MHKQYLPLCHNFKNNTNMARTITVRGKANLSVSPDTIILSLNFHEVEDEYNFARELSLSVYNQVLKIAENNGLTVKDVKTVSYSIESEYEDVRIRDKWTKQFIGYGLRHKIKILLDINDVLVLGNIIMGVDKCKIKPKVSIAYTVKDTTDAKEQLLALAVKSSQSKAIAITTAAGVELGDVQSIDYSWREMHIISERHDMVYGASLCEESSPAMDFTPEDIDISDSVTVIWSIK